MKKGNKVTVPPRHCEGGFKPFCLDALLRLRRTQQTSAECFVRVRADPRDEEDTSASKSEKHKKKRRSHHQRRWCPMTGGRFFAGFNAPSRQSFASFITGLVLGGEAASISGRKSDPGDPRNYSTSRDIWLLSGLIKLKWLSVEMKTVWLDFSGLIPRGQSRTYNCLRHTHTHTTDNYQQPY